jgi:hypothetical protein
VIFQNTESATSQARPATPPKLAMPAPDHGVVECAMEPITTSGASLAKTLSIIKDFPLWLLTAIALALAVFLVLPSFAGAAITSAIFAGCRFASLVIAEIRTYQLSLKARRTFHLTPTTRDCHWGSTRQQDGTITTQITVSLMAKNLSGRMLHLLTARLIKPKIAGEILTNILLIEDRQTREYGSVQMTGRHIPPDAIRALAITIIVRGVPKQKAGKVRPLPAVLSIADAEGNEQRVKVDLRPFDVNATALRAP